VADDVKQPPYAALVETGELERRAAVAKRRLASCDLCPRECGADRLAGEDGTCRTGRHARVSSAFPHHGEEDVLRGTRGSGTIFFSGCNLHCAFCQNHSISHGDEGEEVSDHAIAGLMLEVQRFGCHNVNLVTPSHVVPQVLSAVGIAANRGLTLPIVWNSSAYDSLDCLALLDGVVSIYMPDLKFWRGETAKRYAHAEDYPERARAAVREMHRQAGDLETGRDGTAIRGLLVRHLVMPGLVEESEAILRFLAEEISRDTFVNVMDQYRPSHRVGRPGATGEAMFPEIARRTGPEEMRRALRAARDAGLHRFDGPGR